MRGRFWHVHCPVSWRRIERINPSLTTMKQLKIWRSLLTALAALGAAACGVDSPTAPRLTGEADRGLVSGLVEGLVQKDVLTRKNALATDITVTAVIDKDGGTLSIPAAGFELTVPKGAVDEPTNFTVTALKGKLVAYEFGPHGITFKNSLQARQDLSVTNWSLLSLRLLTAGYFAEKEHLDYAAKTALLSEVINGVTTPLTKQFNWRIDHFSGYIVAW